MQSIVFTYNCYSIYITYGHSRISVSLSYIFSSIEDEDSTRVYNSCFGSNYYRSINRLNHRINSMSYAKWM